MTSPRFDYQGRGLMWSFAQADERTSEDLRMLAEGGLERFRRQFAFDGSDFLHSPSEEE
jgi:hypothetical protein